MVSNHKLQLLLLLSTLICKAVSKEGCQNAQCSPFFTLPCSFGSLDPCIQKTCKEICSKDENRKMIACYCRGTVEGPTLRACFCSKSKKMVAF
uniref:Uncharacterized protein n=1 Tax=Ditylenchus dipsaci TaxID=166011 RepID=A0A915ELD9_9BILA